MNLNRYLSKRLDVLGVDGNSHTENIIRTMSESIAARVVDGGSYASRKRAKRMREFFVTTPELLGAKICSED
jgi:hypothetical protein